MAKLYSDSQILLKQKIISSITKFSKYIGSTFGPAGKNILIHNKNNFPFVTKDGITVAKNIVFDDPEENTIAQLLLQAAQQTEKISGDGTTSTAIITAAIICEAQKYLSTGWHLYQIEQGMRKAIDYIIDNLIKTSFPIKSLEQIKQIATISANNDLSIGNIISEAIDKIGKNGSIVVEYSNISQTVLSIVEGYQLPAGYNSQSFVEEGKAFIKYNNPYFLITDNKIELVEELLPILKVAARENRPLVIIADYIEGQALAALIMNVVRGTMKIAAINAPFYGNNKKDLLKDIAMVTGATLISAEAGQSIMTAKLEHMGQASTVEIFKSKTIVIDGKGNQNLINQKIELLKEEIKQESDLSICQLIQERLTRLSSAIAIIKIGGNSDVEITEKRFRIEDALEAVKSAQEMGICIGAGMKLYNISLDMLNDLINKETTTQNEEEEIGIRIIQRAIKYPTVQLLKNANLNPELILTMMKDEVRQKENNNIVYDVLSNHYVDAFEKGIIDPTKVIMCSLKNAFSVSQALLSSEYSIIEI